LELRDNVETGIDLPPEFCHYRDEGCDLAESCLDCPFDECVFDEPGGIQRKMKKERNTEMARMYRDEGKDVRELAEKFGVSRRTVQRALKSAGGGREKRGKSDK
jgi:hypothetical protein